MNVRTWVGVVSVVGCVVMLSLTGVASPQGQSVECQSVGETQVCIEEFDVQKNTLLVGEETEFVLTLDNVGERNATTNVVMFHDQPGDLEPRVIDFGELRVGAGETRTVRQGLNASTVGTHRIQIEVLEADTLQSYHRSAPETLEIREELPAIDRATVAMTVLLLALAGLALLGYRELGE